ncbi:hypothetical protein IMCGPPIG_03711 [Stenotrophomonas maltophilia]|nr:hypothetical protein PLCFDHLH_01575 [Stenotrophomonas maltophilia]QNG92448.1 hypothetical protein IMCGPPIG_03711 [Stenotrophomonas maltophilia]
MPLRTNVLRRRPLAVTSPFTSYARASALRSEFVGASLKADCSQPYPPQAEPRRGGQGVGQSKGGGDGQRPAPGDICPGPCLSRRGPSVRGESGRRHACGGFILRGAGRRPLRTNVLRRRPLAVTSPFTSYARASARRSEFAGASLKGGRERCDLLAGSRASSGRAGPIGSRRIRTKTCVWRMHSARRRAETLAYECPPAGPFSLQRRRTKTRFGIQTTSKKRPGRGRDLPGPDCVGGGTHAMSVASRQWLFASAVDSL